MGHETSPDVRARAIEWHVRLRDGDDAAWDAFCAWLAEDAAHAEAYDAVEQADLALEPLLRRAVFPEPVSPEPVSPEAVSPEPANDRPRLPLGARRRSPWPYAGAALAASLVLVLAIALGRPAGRYEVTTAAGQQKVVALDAATTATLNGATRLVLDRRDPRYAALVSGEALFQVRHDGARPFRVKVGRNLIEDVGTVFDVVHEAQTIRVAVAEGAVVYQPGGAGVPVSAGHVLVDEAGAGPPRVIQTPAASVGAWRSGRFLYSAAPLAQVAADLGRFLGVRIAVSPALAGRPFSGSVVLDGSGPDQLRRLAPALDVDLAPTPDGWTMKPASRASP